MNISCLSSRSGMALSQAGEMVINDPTHWHTLSSGTIGVTALRASRAGDR
jgi:hypothetical protein